MRKVSTEQSFANIVLESWGPRLCKQLKLWGEKVWFNSMSVLIRAQQKGWNCRKHRHSHFMFLYWTRDVCKGSICVGLFFTLQYDCEISCWKNIASPLWSVGAYEPFPNLFLVIASAQFYNAEKRAGLTAVCKLRTAWLQLRRNCVC